MELTSFKPRSLPLIQNIQIESKCIQFRDPKRNRSVGYLIEMQLQAGWSSFHLFTSDPPLAEGGRLRMSPPIGWVSPGIPPLSQLPQFLYCRVIDDDNNAACLAPPWSALCELMEACRLCTGRVPPRQLLCRPGTLSSLVGRDSCPSLLRQGKGRLKEIRLREREIRLCETPTTKQDLPCPLVLCV